MEDLLSDCARAVIEGSGERAEELAGLALESGFPVLRVIEEGFAEGIREVGRLWEEGAYFLPELVVGAEAMKRAMAVLGPALGDGPGAGGLGRVVIGTIEGDIHDIGKTLVANMLAANGFTVTDLGANVPADRFVAEAESQGADCVAVSSLLTTTMVGQEKVVEELERRSLRGSVKVLVGGAPVSESWAKEIGADGYAGDAVAAVALAKRALGRDA
ncbi:MAG: cobalamin B12-binding domain-containing protein [Planctomycetota bacterium]|jgi:corrinoid protein of di/trimethylamine methyltransferase